jgi:hypothetical protein
MPSGNSVRGNRPETCGSANRFDAAGNRCSGSGVQQAQLRELRRTRPCARGFPSDARVAALTGSLPPHVSGRFCIEFPKSTFGDQRLRFEASAPQTLEVGAKRIPPKRRRRPPRDDAAKSARAQAVINVAGGKFCRAELRVCGSRCLEARSQGRALSDYAAWWERRAR